MDSSQLWMWLEDLKWCPSQISYYFQDDTGKKWEIYLRWRHNDPWTAGEDIRDNCYVLSNRPYNIPSDNYGYIPEC